MNKYKIDIALVIDATGSMGPIIEKFKENPLYIVDKIKEKMELHGRLVGSMRVRVIDFADFAIEGEDAIHATRFFNIPEEQTQFENHVRRIRYEERGGDEPENALEALWVAMNSDWVDLSDYMWGRQVIVLITDALPLNLGERAGCRGYVYNNYPQNISEMEEIWSERSMGNGRTKLNTYKKRLLLFAPNAVDKAGHTWSQVSGWESTALVTVEPESISTDYLKETLPDLIMEIVRDY